MIGFDDIRKEGLLLYEYVRGSHAYGLQKPDGSSDIDTGGVFIEPYEWIAGLGHDAVEQVADARGDTVWYALKKYLRLLIVANPTMLESLFVPERCVLYEHPLFGTIKANRDIFVTKECFKSFLGYAVNQIKKCRGLHKMIVQEDFERKQPLDFCYTFYGQGSSKITNWLEYRGLKQEYCGLVNIPNMRDIYGCYYDWHRHFTECGITYEELIETFLNGRPDTNLSVVIDRIKTCSDNAEKEHLERMRELAVKWNMVDFITREVLGMNEIYDEHAACAVIAEWMNRLQDNHYSGIVGPDGQSNEIRLSSIPKGEMPICNISYNKDGYTKHCVEYKNLQRWKRERNPERYKENVGKNFDRKNVAHAVRLMHMGIEIARTGKVNVDRTDIDRDFIMGIRMGDTSYDEIMSYLESKKSELEDAMMTSTIPDSVDMDKVSELLVAMREQFNNVKN